MVPRPDTRRWPSSWQRGWRRTWSPKPRNPPRRSAPPRRRPAAPDPAPAETSRGMSAAGADQIRVTTSFLGLAWTREGMAPRIHSRRSRRRRPRPCCKLLLLEQPALYRQHLRNISLVPLLYISSFFFIVVCRRKKLWKTLGPYEKYHVVATNKWRRRIFNIISF